MSPLSCFFWFYFSYPLISAPASSHRVAFLPLTLAHTAVPRMQWYERAVESSVSLCRSLLSGNEELRKEFDKVLVSNGLEKLANRDVVDGGLHSEAEAIAELTWVREFLQNVKHRNDVLGLAHRGRPVLRADENPDERPAESRSEPPTTPAPPNPGLQSIQENNDDFEDSEEPDEPEYENASETVAYKPVDTSATDGPLADGPLNSNIPVGSDKPVEPDQSDVSGPADASADPPASPALPMDPQRESSSEPAHTTRSERTLQNARALQRRPNEAEPVMPPKISSMRLPRDRSKNRSDNSSENITGTESPRGIRKVGRPRKNSAPEKPELWCVCQRPSFGQMVGCDNPNCRFEWFHLPCVGLRSMPRNSKWYCPPCRKAAARELTSQRQPSPGRSGRSGRSRRAVSRR